MDIDALVNMDAEAFLKTASDPQQWLKRSRVLRSCADLVFEEFERLFLAQGDDLGHSPDVVGYMVTAQMLYGFSLEAGLKARILKSDPESIQFDVTTNGKGKMQSVVIREFGGKLSDGHDLERLAKQAGLLKQDTNGDTREALRYLSDCIRWRARYPIPRKIGPDRRPFGTVPVVRRDKWVHNFAEQLLDQLHDTLDDDDDGAAAPDPTGDTV